VNKPNYLRFRNTQEGNSLNDFMQFYKCFHTKQTKQMDFVFKMYVNIRTINVKKKQLKYVAVK